ncbi:MAG TPA: hypothetical protein VFZ09_06730 [Archangium sp.]|uniref:hypothetical protein n=1 Tax=Archangium sp. TaxID=1872627 RepID=UPI002E2F68CA|nr:hypothetical protein [Archangium sp.]HEX5745920.1 hypothetical protein [Archangium sp.]
MSEQNRESCLGELATSSGANRAVLVTLTVGKKEITSIEGVVVSAGGEVLYRQKLTGDKELSTPKDPKKRAPKVFTPIAVGELSKQMRPHLLGAKRYSELRIEKPAQDSVVSGGEVLVEALLVLRKGVQNHPSEPQQLVFTVARGGDEASTTLAQKEAAEKGKFSTVWTPTKAGDYLIQVAYPVGGLSATVRVKVVPECSPGCKEQQLCTMKGCVDCYSLSLQKPAQGAEFKVSEKVAVEARLEMREACTQPAPGQLDFTVARSDGGASTALTLKEKETEKGTYIAEWTPAEAGEYTLQPAAGGVRTTVRVKAVRTWKTPVGIASAGVGLVGGGVLAAIFASQGGTAHDELAKFYENGAAPDPSLRDEVARLRSDIERNRTQALVSGAVGVGLIGVGAALWFIDKPSETKAPGSASLSIGPGGVGLQVLLP